MCERWRRGGGGGMEHGRGALARYTQVTVWEPCGNHAFSSPTLFARCRIESAYCSACSCDICGNRRRTRPCRLQITYCSVRMLGPERRMREVVVGVRVWLVGG